MSWHVTGVCAGDVPEDAAGSAAPAPLPTGWRQLPPQETPAQVGVLAGCSFGDSAISDGNLSCSKSAAPMRAWLGGMQRGRGKGRQSHGPAGFPVPQVMGEMLWSCQGLGDSTSPGQGCA